MKTKLIALALFAATGATVMFFSGIQNIGAIDRPQVRPLPQLTPTNAGVTQQRPKVEVVFVLDTTGSMGGLIDAAKEKIWSVATSLASAQPTPEIRMGLVAYRDRGDAYVTQVVDLSDDLDSMYTRLMSFQANGGGDGPESVNQALYDAVHKLSWSQDPNAYKTLFLVGDAPPHMDYQDETRYPETVATAKQRGIRVNTIQCGENNRTNREWQRIAQLGNGRYFQVEQAGSAVAIATPYDKQLAALSRELDETRIYYGDDDTKEKQQRKFAAAEKLHAESSLASRARRATFNASAGGAANFLGEGELIDDVSSGRVDITKLDQDLLPAPMQAMAPEQRKAHVEREAQKREQLQRQIKQLAAQRAGFLKQKVEQNGGAEESLDHKLYQTVREQAADQGMDYRADVIEY